MKIALLLSGETRSFFEVPSLLDGLQQNGITVDVFAHLPATDTAIAAFISFWKQPPEGFQLRSLQIAEVQDLPEYDYKESPYAIQRAWYKSTVKAPSTLLQAFLRHTAAGEAVGAMLAEAELQDGERYDWVIKTRYDLKFLRPVEQLSSLPPPSPQQIYFPAHDNWGGYNDKLCFGHSEAVAIRSQLFSAIPHLHEAGCLIHTERMLMAHMDVNGIAPLRTRSISRVERYGEQDTIAWRTEYGDLVTPEFIPAEWGLDVPLSGDVWITLEGQKLSCFHKDVQP